MEASSSIDYRGRLAPSPSGNLHLGHAATFLAAARRAWQAAGILVLRIEDLIVGSDPFAIEAAQVDDLKWLGIRWSEGPDVGGPFAPYRQSERVASYRVAFERLHSLGLLYPCTCSRSDIAMSQTAPHEFARASPGTEPLYSGTCRRKTLVDIPLGIPYAWRFRVTDGERITFFDSCAGEQVFIAGRDFGDFPIWRKDGLPSYQLACVVDDFAMRITEVVRGADLLLSTARQILLYRALGLQPPAFHHVPLVCDSHGIRLSKRDGATSLRALRLQGATPQEIHDLAARAARIYPTKLPAPEPLM